MRKRDVLIGRLDAIARSVERSGDGLALIALGSAGLEMNRLDDFSDLDFFVIAVPGRKQRFIANLDWLNGVAPLAYQFRNTVDGYKVLFDDGVFCEFAVFEPSELPDIPFAPGRLLWKRSDVEDSIAVPVKKTNASAGSSPDWLLGEALTNLYVGMSRYRRGEKLSAARFVQQYAVDRVIELFELGSTSSPQGKDPFSPERRVEGRHPDLAKALPDFVQGYNRTAESALAILDQLSKQYVVNAAMALAIRRLCE